MRPFLLLIGAAAGTLSLLAAAACSSPSPSRREGRPSGGDALHARITSELQEFVSWLQDHDQRGYIGEVGWPGEPGGHAARWNGLAESWFALADQAGLWITTWATGEWWPPDYRLALYEARGGRGVDSTNAQADVLEGHLDVSGVMRGINVAGGEFAAPTDEATSSFSNRNPGTYQRDYHYESSETFGYLASRGIALVRVPFRWERVQPRLGEQLDPAELRRLQEVVSRAASAGLQVILDMHNYGAFYLQEGGRGVRCPVGSNDCPVDTFVDAWRRISAAFEDNDAVIAYGLMNEPVGLEPARGLSEAELWQRASQDALAAIRERGDDKVIMVPGYFWAGVQHWTTHNPRPWIDDPVDNFLYEAHHYFDADGSGRYRHSYSEEVAAAREQGYATD